MNGVGMGGRAGDTLELFSLKDLHVEQKFYVSTSALRVEVSTTVGKQRAIDSQDCLEG